MANRSQSMEHDLLNANHGRSITLTWRRCSGWTRRDLGYWPSFRQIDICVLCSLCILSGSGISSDVICMTDRFFSRSLDSHVVLYRFGCMFLAKNTTRVGMVHGMRWLYGRFGSRNLSRNVWLDNFMFVLLHFFRILSFAFELTLASTSVCLPWLRIFHDHRCIPWISREKLTGYDARYLLQTNSNIDTVQYPMCRIAWYRTKPDETSGYSSPNSPNLLIM